MKKTIIACLIVLLIAVGVGCSIIMQPEAVISGQAEDMEVQEESRFSIVYTEKIYPFNSPMRVIHDNSRNVTCWKVGHGLSCIPDHMLTLEGYNANNI